jgi:hypothetical protein
MICLGCGADVTGDCEDCFEKLKATLATGHWPLETSMSPNALSAVETGCRIMLERAPWGTSRDQQRTRGELQNLVAIIRAHLQHVQEETFAARRRQRVEKDPLLL